MLEGKYECRISFVLVLSQNCDLREGPFLIRGGGGGFFIFSKKLRGPPLFLYLTLPCSLPKQNKNLVFPVTVL